METFSAFPFLRNGCCGLVLRNALFLNAGTFATALTQKVKLGAPYFAGFVQHNAFNIGAIDGERTLHTDAITYFSNGKRCSGPIALALDAIALKALDAGFGAFNYLIVYGYVISCLKTGMLFGFC
jgi:hypothetical protein